MKKQTTIILVVLIIAIVVGSIIFISTKGKDKKELKLQTVQEMQEMINTIYTNRQTELPQLETTEIDITDEMQVTTFTGLKTNKNIENLVISVPLMNSQAYSLAVIKVSKDADVEQMKQEIKDNIDMRRWICVSAEKLYVTNYENIIFLVMSSEEWAKPVYEDFKKYVGNDIGKELEKSEEIDIDLPPEL